MLRDEQGVKLPGGELKDAFSITGPAVVSFSGGRTSGYMLRRITESCGPDLTARGVMVVFNNTGLEREETLKFVERCAQRFDVEVRWLEYRYLAPIPVPTRAADWAGLDEDEKAERWDVWHAAIGPIREQHEATVKAESARRKTLPRKERKGLPRLKRGIGRHTFVEVDFHTASRCGEPLEEVIAARNMLPNVISRFCTVECKIRTTQRFLKSIGWSNWKNAIGFRADEPHRVAKLNKTNRHNNEEPFCPLYKAGITKEQILAWWDANDFNLELQDHEGNCTLCFLKGAGKIREIMKRRPELAAWWIRMEASAVRRGLARNPSVAMFRKDRPKYAVQLEMAQRATLFDDIAEDDELSIACHCTD